MSYDASSEMVFTRCMQQNHSALSGRIRRAGTITARKDEPVEDPEPDQEPAPMEEPTDPDTGRPVEDPEESNGPGRNVRNNINPSQVTRFDQW
jgi:hypothetical protein